MVRRLANELQCEVMNDNNKKNTYNIAGEELESTKSEKDSKTFIKQLEQNYFTELRLFWFDLTR